MKQHRLLVIHDVEFESPKGTLRWAFASRSLALARYAPDDFVVTRCCSPELPVDRLHEFDVIFNLETSSPQRDRIRRFNKHAPLVVSFNNDSHNAKAISRWNLAYRQADILLVNNFDMWNHMGRLPRTVNISNGICGDTFHPVTPIAEREHRVFWTGGKNPAKGKSFDTVIQPAISKAEELGFIMDMRPVNNIIPEEVLTTEEMVAKYQQSSYVICASRTDATFGVGLEGAACGCVPVSTRIGAVTEYGVDHVNYVPIEPTPESLIEGLLYAREHRERLSQAASSTLRSWYYGEPGNRAAWFWHLFRRLIEDGPKSIQPFTYMETPAEHI